MTPLRVLAFLLFVASGSCSLLYQVVWLRLAFAAFGIVTPVLSVVLSVFMLGLALGSWLAGRCAEPLVARTRRSAAVLYGLAEWGIGLGALVVPWAFACGEEWLLSFGEASSTGYMWLSALVIAASLLPFATLMGATFPLMMAFLRAHDRGGEDSFSFLYLGNVIGAMTGALATALVLIEALGFHRTLLVAAFANAVIGAVAFLLPRLARRIATAAAGAVAPARTAAAPHRRLGSDAAAVLSPRLRKWLLFGTGFTSMAMEVVWTRAFTPVLQTTIYAFASVLTVYLLATWIGSWSYRRHLRRQRPLGADLLLAVLFPASLLPLVLADPRWIDSPAVVLVSIVPISALLGYLTPQLVDEHARGEPRAAGSAYATNVLGCIAGPLVAGYLLLPGLGVKWSLLLLAAAYPAFLLPALRARPRPATLGAAGAGVLVLTLAVAVVTTHEDPAVYGSAEVRRDHVASVVSTGTGMDRRLLVNGVGITNLTPVTKVMAHLPLVMRPQLPQSTLAICFGMGTTFRSLTTWGGRTTAVELVPSVRDAFGYYWSDAAVVMARPGARVVIDDGRRFLKRTAELFDLITIDPPPPVEAAGSSLLYSVEFYRTVRARLAPGGLLAQWFPGGEQAIEQAVANSLFRSFPHVLVYRAVEDYGTHFLASEHPIAPPTAAEAVARLPPDALRDALEWHPEYQPQQIWEIVLGKRVAIESVLPADRRLAITDDRPFNEYFLLRRSLQSLRAMLDRTLPMPAAGGDNR